MFCEFFHFDSEESSFKKTFRFKPNKKLFILNLLLQTLLFVYVELST